MNSHMDNSNQNSFGNDITNSFDNHSDAVYIMNLQGDILYTNEAACGFLSYSVEELLKLNFREIISSESLEVFNYYFQKAATSDIEEFIIGVNSKNGKRSEFKMVTMSNEKEGQIVNITGLLTEITKQKNVNLVYSQASKDLCESFIENNRDPILLLDLDATIILANRAFSQLLGWRKENLEGFHILLCPSIPPYLIEQMRDYYHRVIKDEPNLATLETVRITTEGIPHYMMLSITPIHDSNANLCNWAVHLRDITAHKEAEQSRLQEDRILARLQEDRILALSKYVVKIADEIKSPLGSLKTFIQSTKTGEKMLYSDNYLDSLIDDINNVEMSMKKLSQFSIELI